MTDAHTPENSRPGGDPAALLLDLNFVPDWARQPPSADPYRDHSGGDTRDDRGRSAGRRDRGGAPRPRQGDRRAAKDPYGRDRNRTRKPTADQSGRRPGADRRPDRSRSPGPRPDTRRHQREAPQRLPIQVSFIPDQEKLATMAADLRAAQHAFPLPELAHLFLNRPQWHAVRFEAHRKRGGAYALSFYQSRLTGLVYYDVEQARRDVLARGVEHYFECETVQKEPPAGQFVCVARCGLSGEWLGPPNHHDYTAAVQHLHQARFGHLSLDDYRRHIETVRDPEAIEAWKEAQRTVTVYRLRPERAAGDAAAEPCTEKEARAYIEQHVLPTDLKRVHKAVLPGPLSREIREPALLALLRAAWAREQRYPATLVRALRGAFKRMKLHVFQTANHSLFVTAVAPHPVDPGGGIPVIREILEWLRAHPGGTRAELIAELRPAAGDDPAKLAELLQPLTWLVEKGHVIEFHNGTLAVPQ